MKESEGLLLLSPHCTYLGENPHSSQPSIQKTQEGEEGEGHVGHQQLLEQELQKDGYLNTNLKQRPEKCGPIWREKSELNWIEKHYKTNEKCKKPSNPSNYLKYKQQKVSEYSSSFLCCFRTEGRNIKGVFALN